MNHRAAGEAQSTDLERRDLEAPNSPEVLYLARGDEVAMFAHRPRFTGDVLRLKNNALVALVQHPCAMANTTSSRLLVNEVRAQNRTPRWSGGDYKRMPLPNLIGEGKFAIEFDLVELIDSLTLAEAERVAILSQLGVNLLLQRWIHHCTRVVVWTETINANTSGPAAEAELAWEMIDEFVDRGWTVEAAVNAVDAWLNLRVGGKRARRYREMLLSPQERSSVRAAARRFARTEPLPGT